MGGLPTDHLVNYGLVNTGIMAETEADSKNSADSHYVKQDFRYVDLTNNSVTLYNPVYAVMINP